MKRTILIIILSIFMIPLTLTSCKDQKRNTGNDPSNTEIPRNNMENRGTETRDPDRNTTERHGNAMDKVEEKADRLVGDYKAALKKAKDRVKNADERIAKAVQEGNTDEVEKARENKRDAEKEVRELEQKIKDQDKR